MPDSFGGNAGKLRHIGSRWGRFIGQDVQGLIAKGHEFKQRLALRRRQRQAVILGEIVGRTRPAQKQADGSRAGLLRIQNILWLCVFIRRERGHKRGFERRRQANSEPAGITGLAGCEVQR